MAERFNTKQNRDTFARQPARVLLIDYRPPFDADTAEYLHKALVDFFSLVTNLHGPIRTPFFGLFALGSFAENLFPLQHVKGNFPRLYSALGELKFFSQEDMNSSITDSIAQGLQDAVNQFKRQSQSFRQMSTSSCQLEVVIITCRSAASVSKRIEQFTNHLELDTLKKIQVAAVQSTDKLQMSERKSPNEHEDSPATSPEDRPTGCGLVDVVLLEKDVLSFQNFFKTWLTDCGTDQEHIRIVLPSVLTPDDEAGDDELSRLTLKCDLHERLLNPALLPAQRDRFIINSEVLGKGGNTAKQINSSVPVYDLVALQLLKSDALCESVKLHSIENTVLNSNEQFPSFQLYGMPFIVLPTLCWKLDWEELESNQQHFHALCTILKIRDLVLLVKTAEVPPAATQRVLPCGHFVLLPSDTGSLLLKSVAVSELMLPSNHQAPSEKASEKAMQVVDSCLDQLEQAREFNPLLISSGLYESLTSQVRKQRPSAKTLKRRFQPPQIKQQLQQKNADRQQLTKKSNAWPSMRRPVIFTASKTESLPHAPHAPHAPQQSSFSNTQQPCNSKRLRTTSAADRYCYSPPPFPEEL